MSCTCERCKKEYKVDFMLPDEIWEQIQPIDKLVGAGLLCGECIIDALERYGYSAWELISLN